MPSPFPGMDPFLENPAIFPDFHDSFVTYLRENLQASLPPPYYAALGCRVWITASRLHGGPLAPMHMFFVREQAHGVRARAHQAVLPLLPLAPHRAPS